jgi:hypothetical protein
MKRILALLLACSILICCCACSSGADGKNETPGFSDAVPVSSSADTTPETEGRPPCPVPDGTDFGGKEFRVLYRESGYAYDITDAFAEEMTGEIVNDAVYNRNLLMETKYGMKFVALPEVSPTDTA